MSSAYQAEVSAVMASMGRPLSSARAMILSSMSVMLRT
jgi:hypothetical protein